MCIAPTKLYWRWGPAHAIQYHSTLGCYTLLHLGILPRREQRTSAKKPPMSVSLPGVLGSTGVWHLLISPNLGPVRSRLGPGERGGTSVWTYLNPLLPLRLDSCRIPSFRRLLVLADHSNPTRQGSTVTSSLFASQVCRAVSQVVVVVGGVRCLRHHSSTLPPLSYPVLSCPILIFLSLGVHLGQLVTTNCLSRRPSFYRVTFLWSPN